MTSMHAFEPKTFEIPEFRLQNGELMREVTLAYRTLGTLAPNRDNVVLVTHGYTSGPQGPGPQPQPGPGPQPQQ